MDTQTQQDKLKQAEDLLQEMRSQRDIIARSLEVVTEQVVHRHSFSKWVLTAIWASIFSAISIGVLGLFWLLWPYGGMQYNLQVIGKSPIQAGTLLTYTSKYCVSPGVPLPITIQREYELQSGDELMTFPIAPSLSYTIQKPCEEFTRVIGVPSYMPAGMYHIHAHTSMRVNPVRTIDQTFVSNLFEIVPAPEHSDAEQDVIEAKEIHDAAGLKK